MSTMRNYFEAWFELLGRVLLPAMLSHDDLIEVPFAML